MKKQIVIACLLAILPGLGFALETTVAPLYIYNNTPNNITIKLTPSIDVKVKSASVARNWGGIVQGALNPVPESIVNMCFKAPVINPNLTTISLNNKMTHNGQSDSDIVSETVSLKPNANLPGTSPDKNHHGAEFFILLGNPNACHQAISTELNRMTREKNPNNPPLSTIDYKLIITPIVKIEILNAQDNKVLVTGTIKIHTINGVSDGVSYVAWDGNSLEYTFVATSVNTTVPFVQSNKYMLQIGNKT